MHVTLHRVPGAVNLVVMLVSCARPVMERSYFAARVTGAVDTRWSGRSTCIAAPPRPLLFGSSQRHFPRCNAAAPNN